MNELASTYCRTMIETLLSVHALMNMYRISEREETRKAAAGWLPNLEHQMEMLKNELTKEIKDVH